MIAFYSWHIPLTYNHYWPLALYCDNLDPCSTRSITPTHPHPQKTRLAPSVYAPGTASHSPHSLSARTSFRIHPTSSFVPFFGVGAALSLNLDTKEWLLIPFFTSVHPPVQLWFICFRFHCWSINLTLTAPLYTEAGHHLIQQSNSRIDYRLIERLTSWQDGDKSVSERSIFLLAYILKAFCFSELLSLILN